LYQKTTLDNGLRILTASMPHTRSVSICIFIGAGSRYETDAEAGTSHFIEHLLFKGTTKRPTSLDISQAIEGIGGIFNGGTDKELTIYWCKVPQSHFNTAAEVMADMVLHSTFDPAEIEKERQVIIEEINMSHDHPAMLVDILIDELLWPKHPLGRDIAGSKESVAAITRNNMLDYLKSRYSPANIVISIAGNIQHEDAVASINHSFGDFSERSQPSPFLPYRQEIASRVRVEKKDTEQVHICLALPGLSVLHPKRFILDLLSTILGESASSRLFTEVRDNLGLTYSINSQAEHFLDSGSFTIYAGVEPRNLTRAIEAILEQLVKVTKPLPQAEIHKSKEFLKGRLLLRMEDSRSVAGWLGGQELLTRQILSVEQVESIIDAITAEELNEMAEELVVENELRLALVGPVANHESLQELLRL